MTFARTRKSRNHALYDSAYRKIRAYVLDRDGWYCTVQVSPQCTPDLRAYDAVATVDHIIPIDIAPHLAHDATNMRAACRPCNNSLGATYGNNKRLGRATPTPASRIW